MHRFVFVSFVLLPFSILNGQGKESGDAPTFVKLYSHDGRESLTAMCRPTTGSVGRDKVECAFVNVRFQPPSSGDMDSFLSIIEGVKAEHHKEGKDPKATRVEVEEARKQFCGEYRKKGTGDAALGPKRKQFTEQLRAACTAPDPILVFQRLASYEQRTCNVWVHQFTLDFTKVKAGQWIFRQEEPGLLSQVLKIYELTGKKYAWTLVETRVPTQGSDEKPSRTVWSTEYPGEYELPCDFIKHTLVQAP